MTWNELLRAELRRLHGQEEEAAQIFVDMRAQASGDPTRTILREAIDGGPSRLARLELILADLDDHGDGRSLRSFEGWREDVRELGQGASFGETHDAAILGLLLRTLRSRTACYEVAHILAQSLEARKFANLLGALVASDDALTSRVCDILVRVIIDGEGRWDLNELNDLKA